MRGTRVRHPGLCSTVLFVFLFGLGLMSGAAGAQDKPTPPSQGTANVGPETPVITMDGYCDGASTTGTTDKARCRTVLTRSEFEQLADASAPATASSPATRNQFAAFYVQFLLFVREAQKQGLDKDPHSQRKLELARIRTLSQILISDLQTKSGQFAPGDVEKFFRENPAPFEQTSLLRVFIPSTKFKDQPDSVQQPIPESAPEMKLVAEAIYSRARAGADFAALQKEAVDASNLKEEEPVKFDDMARDQLRQSQRGVFDLKPGEISPLYEERGEGYYIYKVVSKKMPAFESVKPQVENALQKHRMDIWVKSITNSAQVSMNEEYFGTNPLPKN
jgi:hypothetical protein